MFGFEEIVLNVKRTKSAIYIGNESHIFSLSKHVLYLFFYQIK